MNSIVAAIIAGATSSGVCSIILYLIQRQDKKADKRSAEEEATRKLLLGLAYDRLVENCTRIIRRGWYTIDEYHDLKKYLFDPYIASGGDGTAERLWKEMEAKPVKEEGEKG